MLKNNQNFLNFPSGRASAALGALSCFPDTGLTVDPLSIEKQQTCLTPAQMQKLRNSEAMDWKGKTRRLIE